MKAYLFSIFLCLFAVYFVYRSNTSKQGLWYESENVQTWMLLCLVFGIIGSLSLSFLILRDIYHFVGGIF